MADEHVQKTLEELSRSLQESKARLEEAQRAAHVGHWEWDLETDVTVEIQAGLSKDDAAAGM